ncbi:hypothetical protein pipiens_008660 [Culex pipiens pipiens]|uniref:Cationic amino acid transporter C-terminal domain-containing protein n=1 Tax=Culex pipiens pipiens TaxID=38569 RepID=A0ABD1DGJ5_CULPP
MTTAVLIVRARLTLLDLAGFGRRQCRSDWARTGLCGSVACEQAGPAVVVVASWSPLWQRLIAGIAAMRSSPRWVPKSWVSAVTSLHYDPIREFAAFTIGWNLMLEYIIGTASVARGLSGYIDALIDYRMANALRSVMEIRVSFMSQYPDFLSFLVVLTIAALLAYGVKESTMLNNIFTGVNLMVIAVVLISVGTKANYANWNIKPEDIPSEIDGGAGGFLPYGVAGVMAGAAKCFYGYVGFDCIATTGEEARNPSRNIPLAIIFSLIIIFLSYFGVATVLTMALPYYLQDPKAPFPNLFDWLGWHEIKWIVSIGAIFSLCTNSLGAMFPLPRVLYAMSSDGIMFKKLRAVNSKTKTPILATIISGAISGTMALLFDLPQLIDMMSIGTLLAYTIVAVSVLVLRYSDNTNFSTETPIQDKTVIVKQLFNLNIAKTPNTISTRIVKISLLVYAFVIVAISAILMHAQDYLSADYPLVLTILTILAMSILVLVLVIACQPTESSKITFRVPLVPFIPMLSMFVNVYLMFQLGAATWIGFSIWLLIGFLIYFTYGIRHSTLGSGSQTLSESQLENPFAMIGVEKV